MLYYTVHFYFVGKFSVMLRGKLNEIFRIFVGDASIVSFLD